MLVDERTIGWIPKPQLAGRAEATSCQNFDDAIMSKRQADDAQGNWLLGAMESASRKRIDPHLEPVKFKLGAVVCEAGGLLKHAYFPQSAVLSLLTVLENGSAIETANIGREGAFGLFAAMYSRVSFNRYLVQLEGGSMPLEPCFVAAPLNESSF